MRILPGGDHQMHLWWQVIDQKGDGVVNPLVVHQIIIIEYEDQIVREEVDFIEQRRENRFDRWQGRGSEYLHHPLSNLRRNCLQCSNEVSQKLRGLVILFVQR